LKIKAADILFPGQVTIHDDVYEITFCIACHIPNPLPLSCIADYNHLVENTLHQKQPMVKVIIKAITHPQKENVPPAAVLRDIVDQVLRPMTKKGKKSQVAPNVNDILPGNVAKNDNIKLLHSCWECATSNCSSEHCYIPTDGPHFALSHNHIDKWAATMLSVMHIATQSRWPVLYKFDAVSMHTIVSKSLLLTSQLQAMEKEKGLQAPVINVVLPANFGLPLPVITQPPPQIQKVMGLIPSTLTKGPRMDINMFCVVYQLPDTILQ
ncbi:hypothetical protein K443DRAFT_37325, partial [Laccaria amethystina LaAM-08-1]